MTFAVCIRQTGGTIFTHAVDGRSPNVRTDLKRGIFSTAYRIRRSYWSCLSML